MRRNTSRKVFLVKRFVDSQILIKNDFEICKLCDFGVSLPLNADGYIDLVKKPDAKYIGELALPVAIPYKISS